MALRTRTDKDVANTETKGTTGLDDARTTPTVGQAVARQREDFGGIKWGSAFFGWLTAMGVAVLLVAAVGAAGAGLGYAELDGSAAETARDSAETIGIGGAIALLVVLMVAYFAGGYVAARMSRLDGARQGVGVWVIGLLVTVALGVAGWALDTEYNIFNRLDLPRIPVDEGSLTAGGLVALLCVAVGTLLAAVIGGRLGMRYHRRMDEIVLPR